LRIDFSRNDGKNEAHPWLQTEFLRPNKKTVVPMTNGTDSNSSFAKAQTQRKTNAKKELAKRDTRLAT
jgi:hypothetical protein